MANNSKLNDGLVPRKIITKNGNETTVYVRPDDGSSAEDVSKEVSGTRSVLQEKDKPSSKKMTVKTVKEANHVVDMLEDSAEGEGNFIAGVEGPDGEKAADAGTVLRARYEAERDNRDELRQQVISMFTDKQVAEGKIKEDSSGNSYIELVDEEERFVASRCQLTPKEAQECSEASLDHNLMRDKFPDTWHALGSSTGNFYMDVDKDNPAFSDTYQKFSKSARRSRDSLPKNPKQSEVISEFINSVERTNRAEEDYRRFSNAYTSSLRENNESVEGMNGEEAMDKMNMQLNAAHNSKSGAKLSCKPNMKYDTSRAAFLEMRCGDHLDEIYSSNPGIREEAADRRANTRANRDWMGCVTMKIRSNKVKEKFPDKWKKARISRNLYIGDFTD